MQAKAFFKTYFWDIVVVGSLALLSSGFAIYLAIPKNSTDHTARITKDNALIQMVDLSLESETQERTFEIQGYKDVMTIGVLKNKIHVLESSCPNQYCIFEGWISDSSKPIVCAYNHISITIGAADNSVIVV